MRKQAAKYRALEADKQSLLEETQTMAADLAAAQRDTAALQVGLCGLLSRSLSSPYLAPLYCTRGRQGTLPLL